MNPSRHKPGAKKIVPGKQPQKPGPVKPKSDLSDLGNFIQNELKSFKNMKVKNEKPPEEDLKANKLRESEKKKNILNESMQKVNLNNKSINQPEQNLNPQLNTTASKFEGFDKANKFSEVKKKSPEENELRTSISTAKLSAQKIEPFQIKFPANQNVSEEVKDISNKLNKNDKNKPPTAKITIRPGAVPLDKKIAIDNKNKTGNKIYDEKLKKINNDTTKKSLNEKPSVKPVENKGEEEEDIPEEYDDFVNEEDLLDIKNKKNNYSEFRYNYDDGDKWNNDQEFNNVENDNKIMEAKKARNARSERLERVRDLKIAIEYKEQFFNLYEFEYKKEVDKNTNDNNGEEEKVMVEDGINTDKINMKDDFTTMNLQYGKDIQNNQLTDKSNNPQNSNQVSSSNNNVNINDQNKKSNGEIINYQPLTYDAYNFFVHISPYIESILLNNINKYTLQHKNNESQESSGIYKLGRDFCFPKELLKYLYNNFENEPTQIFFKKFLFFDTKPSQIAFAISITKKNKSKTSQMFSDEADNSSFNLILLYEIFNTHIVKIFFSFSEITDMALIGENESILLTSRIDGQFDVFDIYNNFNEDFYYMNLENKVALTRENLESKKKPQNEFKLILPLFTTSLQYSFDSIGPIKKICKYVDDNGKTDKMFNYCSISKNGQLVLFNFRDASTHNISMLENSIKSPDVFYNINSLINRVFDADNNMTLSCFDMKYYDKNILFMLCNFGLCKIDIEGKENFIIKVIYKNHSKENDNIMTAFDISDTGNLVLCFNDQSIQILSNDFKEVVYTSYVTDLSENTILDKVVWSNIICKNDKGKLIRRSMLANFYIFTSKNDFIIFDLNQKVIGETKKAKKKKDFGKKLALTRKNSIIDISNSCFNDYSNFILMSNSKEDNKGEVELIKLSLRKQFYEEHSIVRTNEKIMNKICNLLKKN